MDPNAPESVAGTLAVAGHAIVPLVIQFALALVLLFIGVYAYTEVTPFRERELIREGNVAAATLLAGAIVSLAIPLAALVATTGRILEIMVWGVVAIVLQLVTCALAYRLLHELRDSIVGGRVAAAVPLVAIQLAVGMLNAAAMIPV